MSSTFYTILLIGVAALSPVTAEVDEVDRFVDRLACSGDGIELEMLEGARGVITSPGYPENYPANAECEWMLSAPPGGSVVLTIHNLYTKSEDDTLIISSELGPNVTLTGSVDEYTYDSQGSKLIVLQFISNSSETESDATSGSGAGLITTPEAEFNDTSPVGFNATYELVSVVHCGPQSATLQLGAIPSHARREDGEVFVEGHANRPGCKVAFSSSDPEDTMLTFPYHTCGGRPDQPFGRFPLTTSRQSINKLTFDVVLGVRHLKAPDMTVVRMRVKCGGRSTQYETPELTTYDIQLRARDVEPPYTFRVYDKSQGEEADDMTRIANGDVITLAATFTHDNITGQEPVGSDDVLALYNCEMFVKGRFNVPRKLLIDKNGCKAAEGVEKIRQIPNQGTEFSYVVKGLPFGATVHFRCSIYLCRHGETAPPGVTCDPTEACILAEFQRAGLLGPQQFIREPL